MTSQTIIRDIQDRKIKTFTRTLIHTQLELEPGPEPGCGILVGPWGLVRVSFSLEFWVQRSQTFSPSYRQGPRDPSHKVVLDSWAPLTSSQSKRPLESVLLS